MKNIVLCTNPALDNEFQVTLRTKSIFESMGYNTRICMSHTPDKNIVLPSGVPITTIHRAINNADLMVCFGGDGTILHAARDAAKKDVPILGVNLGHRGFMTAMEADEIEQLSDIISEKFTIDERMMLDIEIIRSGEKVYSDIALNEAVVIKGAVARIIDVTVFTDGMKTTAISGDGVVICTPTGSTAYSMAAGGPIVDTGIDGFTITPICSHALQAKSYVIAPSRYLTIAVGDLTGKSAYFSADGRKVFKLKGNDQVIVSKSKYKTKLIQRSNQNIYEVINKKLNKPRSEIDLDIKF